MSKGIVREWIGGLVTGWGLCGRLREGAGGTFYEMKKGAGGTFYGVILAGMLVAGGSGEARADLPSLNEAPWFGFFAGHDGNRGKFGIARDGVLYYNHSEDLENVNSGYFHRIRPAVEEARPDGAIVIRRLVTETLESDDEPAIDSDRITFRGQVQGGARVEVVVEFGRREVSVGGRIIEPAPGDPPQRFVLETRAPPFYRSYNERQILREGSPEERARLERRNARQEATASRENLVLRRLGGSRERVPLLDEIDLSCPEFNEGGFSGIEIDIDALRGRRVRIGTTEDSRMTFSNEESKPVFKNSYTFTWHEDPARRNAGTGRLVFETR